MRALSAALAAKTIKTQQQGGPDALRVAAATRRSAAYLPNLLYKPTLVPQPLVVRISFAVWFSLTAALCSASAQDQEKKLVDRLLKPEMTLQNDAQNKKFTGDGSASLNKRANVGSFYVHRKPRSKDFSGTRDFSTTQFYSQTYHGGRKAYETSSQQTVANSKAPFADQTARGVRDAPQSGKKVASRSYGGNRPFLNEGTNQKSLNRHNEPLTIEQVRELLNKNK
jgi:hypothetical protein